MRLQCDNGAAPLVECASIVLVLLCKTSIIITIVYRGNFATMVPTKCSHWSHKWTKSYLNQPLLFAKVHTIRFTMWMWTTAWYAIYHKITISFTCLIKYFLSFSRITRYIYSTEERFSIIIWVTYTHIYNHEWSITSFSHPCRMKLVNHSQTSMVQLLKLGNG